MEFSEVAFAGPVPVAADVDHRSIDDSAESPRAEIAERSLLDRLLDEADALRAAEAVRVDEPTMSTNDFGQPSSSATASSNSARVERAPGVLHQRADATRRAFSRADALVSLAQRYLRGDRPERSPIEVTIELGTDHRPLFRDAHGRVVVEVPARPAVVDLGWPRIRAMNAPLGIDADTPACGWDGRPADYGAIVGHLLAADRPSWSPSGPPR